MTYEDAPLRLRRTVGHYYGDTVRILFVVAAVMLLVAKTTGAEIPLSLMNTVVATIVLVIAAGITNPEQGWIHWANEAIAIVGTLVFTPSALGYWQLGLGILDRSYLFTEGIALLSLVSLYFATKTLRGLLLRVKLQ